MFPKAEKALEAIFDKHLELVGVNSACNIKKKIEKSINVLSVTPYIGKLIGEETLDRIGFRRIVCGNYICVYLISDNTVYIADLIDGRTDYISKIQ
jgi:plasmid stabilization system protein ParE